MQIFTSNNYAALHACLLNCDHAEDHREASSGRRNYYRKDHGPLKVFLSCNCSKRVRLTRVAIAIGPLMPCPPVTVKVFPWPPRRNPYLHCQLAQLPTQCLIDVLARREFLGWVPTKNGGAAAPGRSPILFTRNNLGIFTRFLGLLETDLGTIRR